MTGISDTRFSTYRTYDTTQYSTVRTMFSKHDVTVYSTIPIISNTIGMYCIHVDGHHGQLKEKTGFLFYIYTVYCTYTDIQ